METTKPSGAVAIFIDGAYLAALRRHVHGGALIDFRALMRVLAGPLQIHGMYYYDAPLLSNDEHYEASLFFYDALRRIPRCEVYLGYLTAVWDPHTRKYQAKQKGVDTRLAIDLARCAWQGHVSKIILIAGDADFIPPLEEARAAGVETELIHSPASLIHEQLRAVAGSCRVFGPMLMDQCRWRRGRHGEQRA